MFASFIGSGRGHSCCASKLHFSSPKHTQNMVLFIAHDMQLPIPVLGYFFSRMQIVFFFFFCLYPQMPKRICAALWMLVLCCFCIVGCGFFLRRPATRLTRLLCCSFANFIICPPNMSNTFVVPQIEHTLYRFQANCIITEKKHSGEKWMYVCARPVGLCMGLLW